MGKAFIKVGLFIFALVFIVNSHASFAMNTGLNIIDKPLKFNVINTASSKQTESQLANNTRSNKSEQKVAPKKLEKKHKKVPKIKKYTIISGDSLIKIAKSHKTTWERLFYKNTKIANPDSINPGQVIIIPTATEKLAQRAITTELPKLATVVESVSQTVQNVARTSYTAHRDSSAGNTYTPGYCTWYAKNRRPDLPNNLGNAISWVSRAYAQGIPTGSTPRAGAIGQQGDHVVYVEKVNSNGTVSISEMNYGGGLFVVNHRTVPASSFMYIY